jgi:hypothetical protein
MGSDLKGRNMKNCYYTYESPECYNTAFKDYSDYFYRNPMDFKFKGKTKDRIKRRIAAARFIFCKYKVPKFLDKAWHDSDSNDRFEERMIFICIGSGQSLYKEYFKTTYTKKETHLFITCPFDLSIRQAKVWAVAMAECNDKHLALKIAKSNIYGHKPVIIRFFAKDPPESTEALNDILDFLDRSYETRHKFVIIGKKFTTKSLIERMEKWHADLRRLKKIGKATWDGYPIKDIMYNVRIQDVPVEYKFTQIKTAQDLQREGNAMRHCVLSYKRQCMSHTTSIWSLTKTMNGIIKRLLTIEVNKYHDGKYKINQVRGLANRLATSQENYYVNLFAKDINNPQFITQDIK